MSQFLQGHKQLKVSNGATLLYRTKIFRKQIQLLMSTSRIYRAGHFFMTTFFQKETSWRHQRCKNCVRWFGESGNILVALFLTRDKLFEIRWCSVRGKTLHRWFVISNGATITSSSSSCSNPGIRFELLRLSHTRLIEMKSGLGID